MSGSVDGTSLDVTGPALDISDVEDMAQSDLGTDDLGAETVNDALTTDSISDTPQWPFQISCNDSTSDIYALSVADVDDDLPLGTVVGCAKFGVIAPDKVALAAKGLGVEASAGIQMWRITYLTKRSFSAKAVATARVLIPDPPPEGPVSLVVVTHGTAGLADQCAPSRTPPPHAMGIPFAGNDTVVVLPDYAGLGNEGVQGYHDSHDTAYSVLDSVKAIQSMFETGFVSKDYAVIGHSQGGGAALYAQGLAQEYLSDFKLKAVVAFAPGWTSSATPDKSLYATPQFWPATMGAGVPMAAMALAHYADAYNHVDEDNPGLYFSDTWRDTIVDWIENECVATMAANFVELGAGVTAMDIFDPAFLMVSLSCLQDEPGCTEPSKSHIERRKANYIPMDGAGAPVLIVQGMADEQVKPMKAACNVKAMGEGGFTPSVSVDPEATHFDIVKRNMGLATDWINGQFNDEMLPTWPFDASVLPTCD